MTEATLTEYLPAADNTDPSIGGAAKITYINVDHSWQTDEGEEIEEPDDYRVECSCGEEFGSWGAATNHAENEH